VSQPEHVPTSERALVRPADRLAQPEPWWYGRSAELRGPRQPHGRMFGFTGPDLGYALRLAQAFADKVVPGPGEHDEDLIAAGVALAMRRAASFGRAPVRGDLEVALTLLGALEPASEDLVAHRRSLIAGCAHDYRRQRLLASAVPDHVLRLSLEMAKERAKDWRSFLPPTLDLPTKRHAEAATTAP
jgi:hypothetical protein